MLDHIKKDDILFLDIETVPRVADYTQLDSYEQELWFEKKGKQKPEDVGHADFYFDNAAIFAEFGKIVCITAGWYIQDGMFQGFEVKSFAGNDEVKLLKDFSFFLRQQFAMNRNLQLCGHNIKEFDVPYICRRLIMNNLKLTDYLESLQTKKPWEAGLLDTMDMWKFGDYKHFTSLKLLTKVLGIPSSKGDIDGSQVAHVFYVDKDIDRIITYCEKDVIAVAQVFLRLRREDLLIEEEILHV